MSSDGRGIPHSKLVVLGLPCSSNIQMFHSEFDEMCMRQVMLIIETLFQIKEVLILHWSKMRHANKPPTIFRFQINHQRIWLIFSFYSFVNLIIYICLYFLHTHKI